MASLEVNNRSVPLATTLLLVKALRARVVVLEQVPPLLRLKPELWATVLAIASLRCVVTIDAL